MYTCMYLNLFRKHNSGTSETVESCYLSFWYFNTSNSLNISILILPMYYIQPFNGLWSGTTRVGRYQKKHSPTHTHPDHRTSFIIFLHLQWSMASTLFILRAWQSSRTTSLQVLFGLGSWTSYSIHFFTQSSFLFAAHAHTYAAYSRDRWIMRKNFANYAQRF